MTPIDSATPSSPVKGPATPSVVPATPAAASAQPGTPRPQRQGKPQKPAKAAVFGAPIKL